MRGPYSIMNRSALTIGRINFEKKEGKKMENTVVNAVGEQCPIPVVKAIKALESMKTPGILEVQVDNEIAVQNLMKMAASKGLKAAAEKLGDKLFKVKIDVQALSESTQSAPPACAPDMRGNTVAVFESEFMGRGNDELGKTLMKGFIYALSQLDELPKAMLFYNGGAKLTVEGAVSVEDLKSMEAQGVEILTCGTCLNFYGLSEKLAVGSVTNMYAIVEKLAAASKIIKP